MPDYRSMFDRDYIGHWDLNGKDVTVTISRVIGGELTAQGGRKSKRPIVYFEKTEKGFVCNKTNAKMIANMYGTDTSDWIGQRITLYATQTSMGGETVDCIRVRPGKPTPKRAAELREVAKARAADAADDARDAAERAEYMQRELEREPGEEG